MSIELSGWASRDEAADDEATRRQAKEREARSAARRFAAHFCRQRADGRMQQVWVQGGAERRCTGAARPDAPLPSVFELAGQCGLRAVRRLLDGPGELAAEPPPSAPAQPEDEADAAPGHQAAEERMLDDVHEWLDALTRLRGRDARGMQDPDARGAQDTRRLFPQLRVRVQRDARGASVELCSQDAAEGHWLQARLPALQSWLSRRWGTAVDCRVNWRNR